jgi:hypothetical protein
MDCIHPTSSALKQTNKTINLPETWAADADARMPACVNVTFITHSTYHSAAQARLAGARALVVSPSAASSPSICCVCQKLWDVCMHSDVECGVA